MLARLPRIAIPVVLLLLALVAIVAAGLGSTGSQTRPFGIRASGADAASARWAPAMRRPASLVDATTSDVLVPRVVPDGWRRVARGVYATGRVPGQGAVVYVQQSATARTADGTAEIERAARAERLRWRSVDHLDTTVLTGRVFGRPGLRISQRADRPIRASSDTQAFTAMEVRTSFAPDGTVTATAIDDPLRPETIEQMTQLLDSLTPTR